MYQVGVGWIPQSDQKGLQFCFINYVRCYQIAMNSYTQQLSNNNYEFIVYRLLAQQLLIGF